VIKLMAALRTSRLHCIWYPYLVVVLVLVLLVVSVVAYAWCTVESGNQQDGASDWQGTTRSDSRDIIEDDDEHRRYSRH
jgi:hypothetical protein